MSEYYPERWGADESQLWGDIAGTRTDDYGDLLAGDRQAQSLFSAGWIDDTGFDRSAIRDAFFDYMIEQGYFDDRYDFDWEAWREYMGYGED
jgi:hypothetical protein